MAQNVYVEWNDPLPNKQICFCTYMYKLEHYTSVNNSTFTVVGISTRSQYV